MVTENAGGYTVAAKSWNALSNYLVLYLKKKSYLKKIMLTREMQFHHNKILLHEGKIVTVLLIIHKKDSILRFMSEILRLNYVSVVLTHPEAMRGMISHEFPC